MKIKTLICISLSAVCVAWAQPQSKGEEKAQKLVEAAEKIETLRLDQKKLPEDEKLRTFEEKIKKFEFDLKLSEEQVRDIERAAEDAAHDAHEIMSRMDWDFNLLAQAKPMPAPAVAPTPPPPHELTGREMRFHFEDGGSEENQYRQATRLLDQREWARAMEAFSKVAFRNGDRADGARYWKAYSLHKLGRRDDALAGLSELAKMHPTSRYLDDAKALEVEIRQASGKPVSPEQQTDEDIKLMAINGLMESDHERAIPLLEGILSRSTSPKLKDRALFVLARHESPQAQKLVVDVAKGKGNPDLQLRAIDYLGGRRKDRGATLVEIYASSSDARVKRRVIEAVSHDPARLVEIARKEANPELKRDAVRRLSEMKSKEAADYLAEILK